MHRYTARHLTNERMWPMSMPCFIEAEDKITLAQFGTQCWAFKTLYREGLKNRYGALMQTISGVHYNFRYLSNFGKAGKYHRDEETGKEAISDGYLRLIIKLLPFWFG